MTRIKLDLLFALFVLSPLVCNGYEIISAESFVPRPSHCSSGQAYWCKNITTAVECRAVKHCITGVWEKMVPIEKDTSSVCDTCIEMVKEARDQLESNETQAEIRQVLEASCKVIPIKMLREDCDKLMDDFGSYLVDTLASEMNPQVVCSVAGLCNNPAFEKTSKRELNCDSCFGLMSQVEDKIETASEEDLRRAFLGICRNFGSFSDACAAFVLNNLPQIASSLQNVKAAPVCTLAGVCTEKFHSHAAIETGDEDVEVISAVNDDLPCDLCDQLIKHLKDILIANTTQDEFKIVLFGLCTEVPENYRNECKQLVETYYGTVYQFLLTELDGKKICTEIGICPGAADVLMRPLLPVEVYAQPAVIEAKPVVQVDLAYQRPALLYDPLSIIPKAMLGTPKPQDQMLCSFCEYFLHFLQQEITLPSSEKKIREFIEQGCARLPVSVAGQCNSFLETYSDAFIALLANRIDPSQVCPGIGVCAGSLVVVEYKDKPTCPLCLLAMEEVHRKVSNRTQEDINDAFDDLCIRDVFPNSLTTECVAFIKSYREPLTDMILADFTAEEACLYSDVCSLPQTFETTKSSGSVSTNEISDDNSGEVEGSDNCVICEFIMTKLEKMLKDKTTEEEIKEDVFKVCNYMPQTVTSKCKKFVEEYADLIIELLTNEITPKQMCVALNLCSKASTLLRSPIRRCLTCEMLLENLKIILTDPDIDRDFNTNLYRACTNVPIKERHTCRLMVNELAPQIEMALRSLPIGPLVCRRIGVCGHPHCGLGPVFWCLTEANAAMCQEEDFCMKYVWNKNKVAESRQTGGGHLKGTDVI